MNIRSKPLNEQEEQVMRMHGEEKLSYQEIAAQMGISAHRARQIYAKATERLRDYAEHQEDALSLLPKRVRDMLERIGLTSRAALREELEQGRLSWDAKWERLRWKGLCLRNNAWKSWVTLHEWAELPKPESKREMTCPHCGGKIPL